MYNILDRCKLFDYNVGGRLVYQTTKKRASGPKCPVTGKRIQGVLYFSFSYCIWFFYICLYCNFLHVCDEYIFEIMTYMKLFCVDLCVCYM